MINKTLKAIILFLIVSAVSFTVGSFLGKILSNTPVWILIFMGIVLSVYSIITIRKHI